jgi:hypothetical protein
VSEGQTESAGLAATVSVKRSVVLLISSVFLRSSVIIGSNLFGSPKLAFAATGEVGGSITLVDSFVLRSSIGLFPSIVGATADASFSSLAESPHLFSSRPFGRTNKLMGLSGLVDFTIAFTGSSTLRFAVSGLAPGDSAVVTAGSVLAIVGSFLGLLPVIGALILLIIVKRRSTKPLESEAQPEMETVGTTALEEGDISAD